MQRNSLTAAVAVLAILPACAFSAGLGDIKTVYLLPMSNGLDQYLASQLTIGSVLQVVTDPQQADAVFCDRLGESLEQKLADLYGQKIKSDKAEPDKASEKTDEKAGDKPDDKADGQSKNFARTGLQGRSSRGTVFLIDRRTRAVLWSNYEQPKYATPESMRHTASQIASKLARALKGK
jgi:hypothetical protein